MSIRERLLGSRDDIGAGSVLLRKLERFSVLSEDDKSALMASVTPAGTLRARQDIVRDGDDPRHVHAILDGWACRYKQLENGRRQITALFLPGDLCDPYVFALHEMDHTIGTLTPVTLARLSESAIRSLMARPQLADVLWADTLVTLAIHREWIVSLGQRSATERLAHLLCEVYSRLHAVGLAENGSCGFPVTQQDLAEALGLTSVHVNRTLQDLRASGLFSLREKRLQIHDFDGLRSLALFDPAYLHLDVKDAPLGAN